MQNRSHRQGAIHLLIISTEKKLIIFTETDTDVMERIFDILMGLNAANKKEAKHYYNCEFWYPIHEKG